MNYASALVTGASRGIGAAIVRALAGRGLRVHAVARSGDALAALAQETGCTAHALDLIDTAAVEALGELDVDVLVNNAGAVSAVKPLYQQSAAEIDAVLDLNLRAVLHVLRVVLPGMVARNRGHVVNIGSIAGLYPFPNVAAYAASKAAIHSLTATLRLDLAGRRVRVTEVAPGRVETDIYREAMGGDAERVRAALFERFEASLPEDVAAAVLAALAMPERSDVSFIEVLPTMQTVGGFQFAERQPRGSR